MDSKKGSRRKFLKGGAAAAAVGAIQSATGQTPAPAKRSLKDEVAYGELPLRDFGTRRRERAALAR